MKPNEELRRQRSTIEGDKVKMGVDDNALAHIMDILTKLYADPELAIIREYSTNAWDSHVEAGVTRPIEVKFPTTMDPHLTITDYGVGLDAEDIANIYSRYGTSTKRNTNAQNGMLGVGCKSALAYSDSFTLTGRKGGKSTTVLIARDEDGAGSMTIISEDDYSDALPEDYHEGVTVQIPAKQNNSIATKAERFYSFWPKGQVVLVDQNGGGKRAPKRIGDEAKNQADPDQQSFWLDDHVLLTKHDWVTEDLVVMGNVAYPLTDGTDPLFAGKRTYGYRDEFHAVCFVPIGAVNFAPSREALMATKRTAETLDALRKHIAAKRDESVEAQIAAAPSAKDAQHLLRVGKRLGYNGVPTWKGRNVVLALQREMPGKQVNGYTPPPSEWAVEVAIEHSYLYVNWNSYAKKAGERGLTLDLDTDCWIFTGFDGKNMTNVKRAKLELWWAQHGRKRADDASRPAPLPKILMVNKLTADEKFWLDGWEIHDWADVTAIVLPTTTDANGATKRLSGSYDLLDDGSFMEGIPAAKIDTSKPLYYVHGNRYNVTKHVAFRTGALDWDNCTVVALSANRIDKFCRDFPGAIALNDAAKQAAERWVKQQTDDIKAAYSVQRSLPHADKLKRLDPNDLNDPKLQKVVKLLKRDISPYIEGSQKFERWVGVVQDRTAVQEAEAALKPYKLLDGIVRSANNEHFVLYLNAAYAAEKGV